MKLHKLLVSAALLALAIPAGLAQDEPVDTGADLTQELPTPDESGLPELPPPPSPGSDPLDPGLPDEFSPNLPAPPPELPAGDDGPAIEPITPPAEPVVPNFDPAADPTAADDPAATGNEPILQSDEGFLIKDAALNDLFQFLAKQAGRQYFHNNKIATPEYRVTGHLNDGNPIQQMEELAFMYGLMLYTKGDTVYALTQAQLNQLPSNEFTYQLRYLRPSDIEQIKELIKPVLSPGTGIVNFEPKTNTVIIIDTAHRIEQARELLHNIDQPKGQIIVETKILRINSAAAERVGFDWSASLGESGVAFDAAYNLNSLFGIGGDIVNFGNNDNASGTFDPTSSIVLSPVQLSGVMRALAEGGIATQISNPTLITEDNEQGSISVIDRVPIITTTTNLGTDIASVSEEVRYKIDESDPTITEDPEKHREIGISMVVTPTLLPDGTVRMRLRPRSAQIVDQIRSAATDNVYPRVTESMIESISRVPDSHTLVVGGFYGEVESRDDNKVPLLGDVPVLNFFFKSKETTKEQTSLVFFVTPTSYDPASRHQNSRQANRIHHALQLTRDHDWVEPEHNPGPAHEPNLRRGIRGLRPQQAPYYPTSTPSNEPRFSRARK